MRTPSSQRGEGKIGCIVSLLVLGIVGAVGFKVVPVMFSNNEFQNAVESIASRAGILPQATVELQLRDKARELQISEALAPGAITLIKSGGEGGSGTCTVRLNYSRKIDLYGVYTFSIDTKVSKSYGYMDSR